MDIKTMEVDGFSMRWEEAGAGQPVIFLHGIPTSPRLWRHVIPKVLHVRCLAWEMVGYGASIPTGKGRDISVARQAEYLSTWMRAIGVDRAVLVGHDLGGGVAQILAVRHPHQVAGLVLINSICYDSWPVLQARVVRTAGSIVERLPNDVFRFLFSQFIRLGHDRPSRERESLEEHWSHYAAADGAAALVRQVHSLDVHDTASISDQLQQLDLPARVIWGAADIFQKIGYGYRLAHDFKAPLTRIEDGKHFVPEDHPEDVAQVVNQLLASLPKR